MSSNTKSKYVPPHLRNKQKAAEVFSAAPPEPPKQKPYEEQFPALKGTVPNSAKVWGGEGSFADKAREWSMHDKMKKQEQDEARIENDMVNNMRHRNLPRFHNVRRFVEEDAPKDQYDDETEQEATEDDGDAWTTVQNKRQIKKRKTVEEIVKEKLAKDYGSDGENDDTVWNEEKQPNETYWDERY